jgi:hypothetical protein
LSEFIDTYDHPKLNQVDINHLNISIIRNEIEAAIESPHGFSAEFYHTFKEKLIHSLYFSTK